MPCSTKNHTYAPAAATVRINASGSRMQNFVCRVLCRNTSIPAIPPAPPKRKAHHSSVFSGMRRLPRFALA